MSLKSTTTSGNASVYNTALALITAAILLAAVAFGSVLQRSGRLPAPPLTGTNCIDEKFQFLNKADLTDVNMVAVGSSATWRNLDMAVIDNALPDATPMNAAPCYLNMKQTAFMSEFLMDAMPDVTTLISVVHLRDFTSCPAVETEFFDPKTARGYLFDKKTPWLLYLKNFSLTPFLLDVKHLKDMRTDPFNMNSMVMDEYGTGFLRVLNPWRPDAILSDTCFDGLNDLEASAKAHGVRLVMVILPTMPSYQTEFDPDGAIHAELRKRITARLTDPDTLIIDAQDLGYSDENFADPVHLRSESTTAFSERVVQGLTSNRLN